MTGAASTWVMAGIAAAGVASSAIAADKQRSAQRRAEEQAQKQGDLAQQQSASNPLDVFSRRRVNTAGFNKGPGSGNAPAGYGASGPVGYAPKNQPLVPNMSTPEGRQQAYNSLPAGSVEKLKRYFNNENDPRGFSATRSGF
jgi:hypothetical protein